MSEKDLWLEKSSQLHGKLKAIPLLVLIWGPYQDQTKYKKLEEIKKQVNNISPEVSAKFSKDLLDEGVGEEYDDLLSAELEHALHADIIVVLNISEGPLVEVTKYMSYKGIAEKFYVLIPEKYNTNNKSMPSEVLRRLSTDRKYFYSRNEFDKCVLAKKTCPGFVKRILLKKFTSGLWNHRCS